eukprot:jgi/Psemu1/3118/gm1.3118_g
MRYHCTIVTYCYAGHERNLIHSSDYALPIKFEGDYQDYAVFKAGRSPDPTTRLPTGIWKGLSRQDMKNWLNFSPKSKKIVVASLRSELLPDGQPDPNAFKPITRKAYTHEHSVTFLEDDTSSGDNHTNASEDLHLAVENDRRGVFHASLGVYKSQTSSSKDQQPLRSSVSPAHPARFLSENPDIRYKRDASTSCGQHPTMLRTEWRFPPRKAPDQQPASTLKDTNTRAVSLKEETKEPNQDGRLHRVSRSSNKQGKRAGRFS